MAKILVADDDRLLLELMERSLARKGHEVEVFADGAEACEAIGEREYDLIVSDLRMPGSGGFDVLRAANERPRRAPVILLSATWLAEEREEAEKLGAHATLGKPVDLPYLFAIADRALLAGRAEQAPAPPPPPLVPPAPAPLHAGPAAPRVAPAESLDGPPRRAGQTDSFRVAAPLVLLMEPEPSMRKMLAYCLKRQGFRITATADAREALELAALEPPEAAVASAAEDDASAVALVEGIRRDPACARTYVLYLYAEDAIADAVAALEGGADAALARPVEPDILFAHVKAGIRRAKARSAQADWPASQGGLAGGNGRTNGNGHRLSGALSGGGE